MTPTTTRTDQLHSLAATLRKVRLGCAAFAAVQFLLYTGPPGVRVPHPVGPWGVAVCAWLLLTNVVSERFERSDDVTVLRRGAVAEVALDSVLVLFIIGLVAFDPVGTEWGLLNIVVLEAAMRLDLRGAIACSAANSAAYVALQVWAQARYDVVNRWNVATFRVGMVLTVAVIGGGIARQLGRQIDAAKQAREEADERARLLRIAADAGRSMSSLGDGEVLDAVTAAALQLGFDAVDVCVLDEGARVWKLERAVNMPAAYVEHGQTADVGLSALVRREGRTVVIDDYVGWEGALPEVRSAGFTTVVGVPVRVAGKVVATLGVGTRRQRPIAAAELECLELLAAQASAAIDAADRQSVALGLREQLAHSAAHDRLTGLPNRAELLVRLDELMTAPGRSVRASGDRVEVAVVVCDLDAFKTFNDSLGHQAGDDLLRAVAERLTRTAAGRLVARLGGDEFAVVIERGGVEAGARLARMLLVDFGESVVVDGNPLSVSLSIGVAAEDQAPINDATSLLRDAGLAMERAKRSGRGRYEVFDPRLRVHAQSRLAAERDLRDALTDGSITVAYQPMVSLETGAILGVEALARWTHPTRGAISPAEFIPLAEETGLIHQVGSRVLELACRQARTWQQIAGPWREGQQGPWREGQQGPWREGQRSPSSLRLSVNVSAVQLASSTCADSVAAVVHAANIDPSSLTLELTESAVMDDVPAVLASVQALAALGVRLAIDDLGRGWSSLAYLTRYPLSELKIDRAFVQGVASRAADRAVVRSLVSLAHDLGLTVVAEGIEDADQLAELARLGCDLGQGFHLYRPQSASDITELVAGGASLRVG